MNRRRVFITGGGGLVGSQAVLFFDRKGWTVCGVDNNMRRDFFGADGDTRGTLERLNKATQHFEHHDLDVRDNRSIRRLVHQVKPDLLIHCASQPSHDLASQRPFDDFDVNARGTLNLLEAARECCPESPFVFLSTNKVYGDAPNEVPLTELETRYDYARTQDWEGIDESCRIDACQHSLFGASKLAADILVQEYGRYFSIPTVCFRASCITGPMQAGAELHGFLAYLARCLREDRGYRVYGYKGKQVRDNIHAFDVCTAIYAFFESPKRAAVYNMGGGRENSLSVLEAIRRFESLTGRRLRIEYLEANRKGDHICYISNMNKFKRDFPQWRITKSLDEILGELIETKLIHRTC